MVIQTDINPSYEFDRWKGFWNERDMWKGCKYRSIYIPADEILKRTNYKWFARLSEKQALAADTLISKHLLVSLGQRSIRCN
jgi:hypothetical protein